MAQGLVVEMMVVVVQVGAVVSRLRQLLRRRRRRLPTVSRLREVGRNLSGENFDGFEFGWCSSDRDSDRELELLGCAGVSSGAERETEVALVSIFFASQRERERVLCLQQRRNCKFAHSTKNALHALSRFYIYKEKAHLLKKQRFHTQNISKRRPLTHLGLHFFALNYKVDGTWNSK